MDSQTIKLTDVTSYAGAIENYSSEALWHLFDGNKENFNIAHECVDRHATEPRKVAVRIAHAEGRDEEITFGEICRWSSKFAHWLVEQGIEKGDRVAFMLEPSFPFYLSMFGAMKCGAVSVPLFTLFGPDGLALRVKDCSPAILVTNSDKAEMARVGCSDLLTRVVVADADFMASLEAYPESYEATTSSSDLAALQYTSGTTRALPEAVKHNHKSIVTLMVAALYGTGIRPTDQFFCPSSPAWGHGMWHGTLAPLAMGTTTGTYSGRFDAERLLKALSDYKITNLAAAATHYRLMKNSGAASKYSYSIEKLSFTGEPIDDDTLEFVDEIFKVPVCSMYGTTEIGVVLVNFPGAEDFDVKPGSLGKAVPGQRLEVQDPKGNPCRPEEVGELMLWRKGGWLSTKDRARIDADGYFYHHGRADDVIISAGWTMSAVEIENVLLKHPGVEDCAVIGVKDEVRGQVAKAFILANRTGDETFLTELQTFTREKLSQHEYPRVIAFVDELPKTPAGKVNRKVLRDREAAIT